MDECPTSLIPISREARRYVLLLVSVGLFMTVLDSTIVNVALPSIAADLHFSDSSLVWVVNAYMIPFGGFLPLCGRLGDHYGYRRLFLFGVVLFCCASLVCGSSAAAGVLIGGRIVQGIAAALIAAIAIPLAMDCCATPAERSRVIGILASVSVCGSSAGALIGGILTSHWSWRWVFFVNVPLAVLVCLLKWMIKVVGEERRCTGPLDTGGAVTITASLMIMVFAALSVPTHGLLARPTLVALLGATALFIGFLILESRAAQPLYPAKLSRNRRFSAGVLLGALWAAAQFTWLFLGTLYMERVLQYDALQVGLAFLPANLIMGTLFLGISTRHVQRFGARWPVVSGLLLIAAGLAVFAHAPVDGRFAVDVLPGMLLLGLGCGAAYNPFIGVTLSSVSSTEYGVASGVLNSAIVMGGAVALAILAAVASAHTSDLVKQSAPFTLALNEGFHRAFLTGVVLACIAALVAALCLPGARAGTAQDVLRWSRQGSEF